MESPWHFRTDTELDDFCRGIADEMVARFGIPEAEALGRINRHWAGHDFLGSEYGWLIYHEPVEYWANHLYWSEGSWWWITGEDRERLGLGPALPSPYP